MSVSVSVELVPVILNNSPVYAGFEAVPSPAYLLIVFEELVYLVNEPTSLYSSE